MGFLRNKTFKNDYNCKAKKGRKVALFFLSFSNGKAIP
jgi:hypothetical protein